MRIIAGSRRGLRIKLPRGADTRPVTGRIRESVFGMLADRVPGAAVLDLFSGAGGFGLESLSRGAAEAVFADISPVCVSGIRRNLELLGLEAEVLCMGALDAAVKLAAEGRKFDIAFLDPPFKSWEEEASGVLGALCGREAVTHGAVIAARCHFKAALPAVPQGLELFREKKYGENRVLLYLYKGKGKNES